MQKHKKSQQKDACAVTASLSDVPTVSYPGVLPGIFDGSHGAWSHEPLNRLCLGNGWKNREERERKGSPFRFPLLAILFDPIPKQRGCLQARSHGKGEKTGIFTLRLRVLKISKNYSRKYQEAPGEEVGIPVVSSGDLWSFFRTFLCKGNRNEPFVSCMMGKLQWHHRHFPVTKSRRRRNFYDGFEEGFWRG